MDDLVSLLGSEPVDQGSLEPDGAARPGGKRDLLGHDVNACPRRGQGAVKSGSLAPSAIDPVARDYPEQLASGYFP
jgi:hypothetical protein